VIAEEPAEPEEPVDPIDPVEPTLVVDDAALLTKRGTFRIDWKKHATGIDADRFELTGVLNPRGADLDPAGALVSMSIGDVEVLAPVGLDSSGRAKLQGAISAKVKLDCRSGAFSIKLSGLDLRSALGLVDASARGTVVVPVSVSVTELGLATETASADLTFAFKTTAGAKSLGRHAFRGDGSNSGVFRASRVRTKARDLGRHRVVVRAALDAADDAGAVNLDDGLTVVIGAADPVVLLAADLRLSKGRLRLADAVPGLKSLSIDITKRRIALDADDIAAGLPSDDASGESADLTIRIVMGTGESAHVYETTIGLSGSRSGWRF